MQIHSNSHEERIVFGTCLRLVLSILCPAVLLWSSGKEDKFVLETKTQTSVGVRNDHV